ncbi:MAG: transcriptional regulator [Syntrophomonadaceae bacterium]|jgi:putative FmdB family regulatory protein|nr:transcriptional regulator [Syntrophomonadaceae bacterium]
MPIYDYKCEECGNFEKMQKMSEPALTECPTCGGEVKRIISKNIGIVFKGSGFYKTDSGSGVKDRIRNLNNERQKDNQALLDGDVKGFVEQSDATAKKVLEA